MAFTLPESRFGMTKVEYNLGVIPDAIPEQSALLAANKLNAHRYLRLTHKQRVFVDAYLGNDFDATKAAIEAGFTEDEAPRVGRKLMKREEIRIAIDLALEYYRECNVLKFERLVDELRVIALTKITDLIDPVNVEMRDDIADDDPRWAAVKSIKRTENKYGETREVVMHDKLAAIEKLLRIIDPQRMREADAASSQQPADVNVNVSIVSVPSGHFVPAPVSPYAADGGVIEHLESPGTVLQAVPPIPSRDDVPLEG